jgi:pimeloyl-ACP methyl ester carboxylesterase
LAGASGIEIQTVRGQGYRLLADVHDLPVDSNAALPVRAAPKTQRVHFCKAHDGARLAYALLGDGPPLVRAANWLSHLEIDWQGPIWTHWLELLSRGRCLIRYDARGNGLSDWDPPSITFEDFVADLGAIFDAAGVQRAPLLGISQGAAVAVAYAARNPERVSALILIGGCARGWRVKRSTALHERFEALMALMRHGWGGQNAAFRQIFTTSFFPEASKEHMEWFNELQRQTSSPANAAAILSSLGDVDVRDDLRRIQAPTLVLHSRSDAVVPMKDGIELASGIPGARFVPLESVNHVWLADEPAWKRFTQELEQFLRDARV